MNFDDMQPVNQASNERIEFYWPGPSAERKEGMTIVGEYLESYTFNEGQPQESTVFKVRTSKGIAGVDGSAVVKRAFQNIEPGTQVGIRFNGKKKGSKGTFYNDFEVRYKPLETQAKSAAEIMGGEEVDLSTLDIVY